MPQLPPQDKDHSELLERFASGQTAAEQLTALLEMSRQKLIVRLAKSEEFKQGLTALHQRLNDKAERTAAIVALGRVASSIKKQREQIDRILAEGVVAPPDEILSWEPADDRAYAVAACRGAVREWSCAFFARVLARENNADHVREEAAKGLIESTPDFKSGIEAVFRELHALQMESNSLGKRLRRVLTAIRIACAEENPIPGEAVGWTFAYNLDRLFRTTRPPSGAVRKELLIEIAELVHALVRSRFSMATLADTYDPLRTVRGWYTPSEWESIVPGVTALKEVTRDMSEAISLLARANVTDDQLLSILPIVTGSDEEALALRQAVAAQTLGLTEDVRNWLTGARPRKQADVAEESQQRHADAYIAELLIRVWLQRRNEGAQTGRIPDDVIEIIDSLARSRSLVVSSDAGEKVEFSALDHEVVGGFVPGLRYVRILQPSVKAVFADGRTRTVRKSLAEPVLEQTNSL